MNAPTPQYQAIVKFAARVGKDIEKILLHGDVPLEQQYDNPYQIKDAIDRFVADEADKRLKAHPDYQGWRDFGVEVDFAMDIIMDFTEDAVSEAQLRYIERGIRTDPAEETQIFNEEMPILPSENTD